MYEMSQLTHQQQKDAYFGAKVFYYSMTAFLSFVILAYNTTLRQNLDQKMMFQPLFFITILICSIYTYHIAGKNPGFLQNQVFEIQENTEIDHDIELKSLNTVKKNFCQICQKFQHLRMKHCKICQKCIHKFDHHCFWIGGCVGELNHRKFFLFLFFQTSLNTFAFFQCFFGMDNYQYSQIVIENGQQIPVYSQEYGALFIGSLICLGFVFFTGILLLYHTFLICFNMTTWEQQRRHRITYLKDYKKGVNPFDRGFYQNIKSIFFHNNQIVEWVPIGVNDSAQEKGFNWCENKYYSCC